MILCTLILNRLILCFLEIDFQILSNAAAVTVGISQIVTRDENNSARIISDWTILLRQSIITL